MKYPDVFGRVGVFSPAFWVTPEIFAYARGAHRRPGTRIAIVTGDQEGDTPESVVRDHQAMVDTLAAAGFALGTEVFAAVRPDGRHQEWFWRREFPAVYRWLFAEAAEAPTAPAQPPRGRAAPPATKSSFARSRTATATASGT